jgi:hypothetical protein
MRECAVSEGMRECAVCEGTRESSSREATAQRIVETSCALRVCIWQRLLRQYLYFGTSKASKLSTWRTAAAARATLAWPADTPRAASAQ